MKNIIYRREACRLCGSRNLELVLPLKATPLADAYISAEHLHEVQSTYPLDLYMCRDCGFSQLLTIVIPQAIYIDYIYETTSSLGLVNHFNNYAEEIIGRMNLEKKSLVVDIGSNDGTLLKAFKERGMRVLGVDPAREIAKRATSEGIETLPDFFSPELSLQILKNHGSATVITANNLYANVDDLINLTDAIHNLLAPNGVFVFESFYIADWMQNLVFDFMYHEHLSYFSVKPLIDFFKQHQLQLIDVQRVPTKGGSLRYYVQRDDGHRAVQPKVSQMVEAETQQGLHKPETFKIYMDTINNRKKQVQNLVKSLRDKGKSIAGFGASATSTTLIYHFELGDSLSFIADDFTAKQNLFSPGYHIPVLSPQALYDKKPDYVIILAWRYVEPILKKHSAFLENGGHFIVPLPTLTQK